MSLFGFKKKHTHLQNTACTCGGACAPSTQSTPAPEGAPVVKVLGSGCAACHTLMEHTEAAARALGLSVKLEAVTDFAEIAKYGVMSTPALVIQETVVSSGKVLTQEEAAKLLEPLAQGKA